MTKTKLALALALLATPAALPALADAPANMRPTRDVAVTYRMTGLPNGPAQGQEMRMAWSVSTNRQRVEPPGNQGWMLVDAGANTATMVMDAQKMVMALPPQTASAMTQGVPPGATFTRKGTAQVAGQTCNEWDVAAPQGKSTICVTEDGVMLRANSEAPGSPRLEATQVTYAPQDPARFQLPAGYQSMQMSMQPTGTTPAR